VTRATRLLPFLLGALLLAGCSQNDNTPEGYPDRSLGEDQGRNDYQVWLNFEQACLEANDDLPAGTAADVCECTWDAYVDEVPFEVFISFDRTIRERIGTVGNNRTDLETIARNVVADYNRGLDDGEERLTVDLVELMESCGPRAA
jgi:hypothetical protein